MGEVNAEVIRIKKIDEHPNADNLQITYAYDYPVIIKKNSFREGDLAIFVNTDACVPLTDPRFSFLKHPRIKAVRLRGVFSCGLIVPLKQGENFEEGQDVSKELGITRWQPQMPSRDKMMGKHGNSIPEPSGLNLIYYDLEALLKYKGHFAHGEEVVMTEKLEGQSQRNVYSSEHQELFTTSHGMFKKLIEDEDEQDSWWRATIKYNLKEKLKTTPDICIYSENYGEHGIYNYGHQKGQCPDIAVFDALNIKTRKWFDYDDLLSLCKQLDLPAVPEIYRGEWDENWTTSDLMKWADGPSLICPEHIREGMVVRTTKDRWDFKVGRMVLKMKGESYLLGKKKNKKR